MEGSMKSNKRINGKVLLILSLFLMAILTIGIFGDIVNAKEVGTKHKEKSKIPYSAVFGYTDRDMHTLYSDHFTIVANYTFYLPVKSYVYVEGSGRIVDFKGVALVAIAIDNDDTEIGYDRSSYRDYVYKVGLTPVFTSTGFETNGLYHLEKGYHTVYLMAGAVVYEDSHGNSHTFIEPVSISIIANNRGDVKRKD